MTAYDYSKYAHRNQEREFSQHSSVAEKRYFNHPKRLSVAMIKAGVRDWQVICTVLLHDAVEDTAIFGNQKIDGYFTAMTDARFRITKAFNHDIAEDVVSLTIPLVDPKVEEFSTKTKCLNFYKTKLTHASVRAVLAKEFDRLDNLSTIELKGEEVALLKLAETEEFYIPLFVKKFSDQYTELQKIGHENIEDLMNLVAAKRVLIKKGVFIGKDDQPIEVGSMVSFGVENQESWGGDLQGILIRVGGEYKIKTQISGIMKIGTKLGQADAGTIKKINI